MTTPRRVRMARRVGFGRRVWSSLRAIAARIVTVETPHVPVPTTAGASPVRPAAMVSLLGRWRVLAGIAVVILVFTALPGLVGAAGSLPSPARAPLDLSSPIPSIPTAADPSVGPSPFDLITKGLLVAALLYVTLRVLRRVQAGPIGGQSRLTVLETRTLAPKASLHLVAIGERRLVVGLTPGGMVALAELDAAELPEMGGLGAAAGPTRPSQVTATDLLASAATRLPGALGDVVSGLFRGPGSRR